MFYKLHEENSQKSLLNGIKKIKAMPLAINHNSILRIKDYSGIYYLAEAKNSHK